MQYMYYSRALNHPNQKVLSPKIRKKKLKCEIFYFNNKSMYICVVLFFIIIFLLNHSQTRLFFLSLSRNNKIKHELSC